MGHSLSPVAVICCHSPDPCDCTLLSTHSCVCVYSVWVKAYMDACNNCLHIKTHIQSHTHKRDSNSLSDEPRLLHAKSRMFVLKTISSPGREAIERHYRHYRRLGLEIGFTSIPWLITICRQQQSEREKAGRWRGTVREGGENDRKWGKGGTSESGGGGGGGLGRERGGRVHLVLSMNIS